MFMQLATVVAALLVGLVAIALVYVLGMRAKSPLVLKPLIGIQRTVINPRQMRSAGTPGAYASVIRHRGRVSGRPYETPVGVVAVDHGFVVALVYGSRSSWVRNVLANGSATIVHEGRTYQVDRPEIVPMQTVQARFTPGDQRGFVVLGVREALRVRRVVEEAGSEQMAQAARTDRVPVVHPARPIEGRRVA